MGYSLFGGATERADLEFLPAALEIVETPATPFARSIALLIAGSVAGAVVWATWARTDIIVVSNGKIIPSGFSKTVQPFEIGVVRAIAVQDGKSVKEGDLLVELDPAMNKAERNRIAGDLESARLDAARLRAMSATEPMRAFVSPPDADPIRVATQRSLIATQIAEQTARLAALDDQYRAKERELETSKAAVDKVRALLPILETLTEMRKTLFGSGSGSKVNYLAAMQSLIEAQKELAVQTAKGQEIEAALPALASTRRQAVSEIERKRLEELTEAERKASALVQDLARADERTRLQQLRAPIDGVVQQLNVHTIGGVVTPAQTLMTIVPKDSPLEIQTSLLNRDVGFVRVGQPVEIKVNTFNFTQYGLLTGTVKSISQDAVSQDDPQQTRRPAAVSPSESEASAQADQQNAYVARVSLDQTRIRVDDDYVNLSPGMAVAVEIKTGSRRLISYLLSPLVRYGHEALRER